MSRPRTFVFGAIALALFGCSTQESACEDRGCGTYHNQTFEENGNQSVTGTIEGVLTPGRRTVVNGNGTIDIFQGDMQQVAFLTLALPDDDDDYDLNEVGAQLYTCASPNAKLLPVATREGPIVPACFEQGIDYVPALVVDLQGTLDVYEPPVSLDLRTEDRGWALHYRLVTSAGPRIDIDVSAWHKRTLTNCGDFY